MNSKSYEAESALGGTTTSNTHCSKQKHKANISSGTITFRNVKVDTDGKYALTLYYLIPEEQRTAYVQVGSDGDKQYCEFHTRDDYDKSKGLYVAIKTIYVHLKAGSNTIIYGNDDGYAPDIDKIMVTPTRDVQTAINDIINDPSSQSSDNPKPRLRIIDNRVVCEIETENGTILYDLTGRRIK